MLQGPVHKRARIMAEDDSSLPFACLPGMRHHALTFSELPARPGNLANMPFVHAQLPGVDEAEPSPSQSAEASQAEAGQSGRLSPSAHAVDSDNYAVHSYQDADKEVYCLPALHTICCAWVHSLKKGDQAGPQEMTGAVKLALTSPVSHGPWST